MKNVDEKVKVSDAKFSTLSTGCELSEQNLIEEVVDVVECTLLIGTVFSGRRTGSIRALGICKRDVSANDFRVGDLEAEYFYLIQIFDQAGQQIRRLPLLHA